MHKVLIVDDEIRLLQSIEAGLTSYKERFQVLTAGETKGEEALFKLLACENIRITFKKHAWQFMVNEPIVDQTLKLTTIFLSSADIC
ncbi:MAG: hypothetical protein ACD_75C02215G0006 [uncultured bacterium]|nr:MAG: hypothetical protein ACD_75C02215G0006 [uncultured bacterium]